MSFSRAARTVAQIAHTAFILGVALASQAIAQTTVNAPLVIIDPQNAVSAGSIPVVISLCADTYGYDLSQLNITLGGVHIESQFVEGLTNKLPGGYSNCSWFTQFSANLVLPVQSATLYVSVPSIGVVGNCPSCYHPLGAANAYYTEATPLRGVSVTAAAQYVDAFVGTSSSRHFTVTNTGAVTDSFSTSMSCTGQSGSCTQSPTTHLTIAAGQSSHVTINYPVSATVGTKGLAKLTATSLSSSTATGNSWSEITSVSSLTQGIVLGSTPDYIDRGSCVRIAIEGAGIVCGDLATDHVLPPIATMNRAWSPRLIYNSRLAWPMPSIAANVTITGSQPDSVTAKLIANGAQVATGKWPGSDWGSNGARRITLAYSDLGDVTGAWNYSLEVDRWNGASKTVINTLTGKLIIVARSTSVFGAGWWLDGLEQLNFIADGTNSYLWIGGDGSARIYRPSGTNIWVASKVRYPDTLTYNGTTFSRHLPGGGHIDFDGSGRHIASVPRVGNATYFDYDGSGRLAKIRIPTPSGTDGTLRYDFSYGTNTLTITASSDYNSANLRRTVTITKSGNFVTSIQDPDGYSRTFEGDANGEKITAQTDKRGTRTTYSYDLGQSLSSVSTNMGTGNPALNVAYKDVLMRGLVLASGTGSSTSLDSAYTMYDGPRTDVADVVKFWVDTLGSPTRVRDALGHETKASYSTTWPGLAVETRDQLEFSRKATFDANTGLLLTSSDSNAFGDGLARTTSYRWNATWRQPTSIIQPLGDSVSFSYDGSGNRVWQEPGSDATRRVSFSYNGVGQVTSVQSPITPASVIAYDALGNVSTRTSSKGWVTTHYRDSYGRDTTTLSPIDISHSQSARAVYDNMGRAWHTTTYGPAMNGKAADSMTVEQTYDAEGNVMYVDRVFVANGMLQRLREISSYDAIGRVTQHVNDQGAAKTFTIDPAGNTTQTVTERGLTITSQYDAASRLLFQYLPAVSAASSQCVWYSQQGIPCSYSMPTRNGSVIIPADTVMNLYDAAGHPTFAGNTAARVQRAYSPGGYLLQETQEIAMMQDPQNDPPQSFSFPDSWNAGCTDPSTCGSQQAVTVGPIITLSDTTSSTSTTTTTSTSSAKGGKKSSKTTSLPGGGVVQPLDAGGPGFDVNFTSTDSYTIGYRYDLDGRLHQLLHPSNIAPCCNSTQSYAYDPVTGDLASVTDILGNVHTLGYDLKGRLTTTASPGWSVTRSYDADDNDTSYTTPWTSTQNGVDALGRMISSNANGLPVTSSYDGMGRAIQTAYLSPDAGVEQFTYDAIGNRVQEHRFLSDPQNPDNGVRNYTVSLTGQVFQITSDPGIQGSFYSQENYEYDNTGNTIHEYGNERRNVSPSYNNYWESRSYYGADEKLRVYSRFAGLGPNSDPSMAGHRAVYEETWYDALGRRVMVRSRRDANCANLPTFPDDCVSALQRYVWDGDQVLYEIRTDGSDSTTWSAMSSNSPSTLRSLPFNPYGVVGYTHVTGVDVPSQIFKTATSAGLQVIVPHVNWRGVYDSANVVSGAVPNVRWPGRTETLDAAPATPNALWDWFGDLSGGNTTGSGQKYMRNRYYDPTTGKFTQRDPVGLAGGLNLYGYAGDDAVNYSDPFGLCTFNKTICRIWQGYVNWREEQGREYLRTCERDSSGRCKPIEMGVPSFLIPGVGGAEAELGAVESQFGNITRELSRYNHFETARLEATGRLVTGSNHVKELEDFANGLRTSAIRLKKLLGNSELDAAARARAEQLLSQVSKLRDRIVETLNR